MIIGNVVAIAQTDQAHACLLDDRQHGLHAHGISRRRPVRYSAAMFYAITYVITTLVGFGIVLVLTQGLRG
jgi:NADH-quinone oxidoreductase subunit N